MIKYSYFLSLKYLNKLKNNPVFKNTREFSDRLIIDDNDKNYSKY